MPRVAIQIDYTDAEPGYFDWLKEGLRRYLAPLQLDALVFIAPNRISKPVPGFTDQSLYEFTEPLINESPIRRNAEQHNDWFVHVLITTYHESRHLGLMYDVGFDPRKRQGCAVFANQIRDDVTGMVYNDFCRVILRIILHELGHCFNLAHTTDLLVMTQTGDLQKRYGQGWIAKIIYLFSPADVRYVIDNPEVCKPGTDHSWIGISSDKAPAHNSNLKISAKPFTDNATRLFETGGAVSFLINIRNVGNRKITVVSPLDPNIENYRIWLKAPRKKERLLISPVQGCGVPTQQLTISAGQNRYFPIHLFADSHGYLFEKTGQYTVVVAILSEKNTWVKSRPISFKIKKTKQSTELANTVNSPDILKFMIFGDSGKKAVKQRIRNTTEAYPHSGFSRAVYWNLYYNLKRKLRTTSDVIMARKLTKKLMEVTDRLLTSETSGIRKGKILLEHQKAAAFLKHDNMNLNTSQKKNIRDYHKFESKCIKKAVANSNLLPQRAIWSVLLLLMTLCQYSCKKVEYVESNVVYGTLSYNDLLKGVQPVPPGQKVNVLINDSLSSLYSFTTSEAGKYSFIPTVKGNYTFEFKYTDTLLQYNASLVEKADLDTLRKNSYQPILYDFKSSSAIEIEKRDKSFQRNVTLQHKETGIRLQMVDEQDHALTEVKVCIYANEKFAAVNAPYCGGCMAYLSSDKNGQVSFVGLQAQPYFINARARIGIASVTNQHAAEMKTTGVLQSGVISTKKIVLK